MFFLGMVQSNLTQNITKDHNSHGLFSLDLFMFCMVVSTGCATFINDELSVKNRMRWLNKFPEALWIISKRPTLTGHMPRVRLSCKAYEETSDIIQMIIFQIFEFLYHLKSQQAHLAREYNPIISNALECVKSNEYFLQKSTWTKFISLK